MAGGPIPPALVDIWNDPEALSALRRKITTRLGHIAQRDGTWDDETEGRLRWLWTHTRKSTRRIAEEMELTPGQVAGRLRDLGLHGTVRAAEKSADSLLSSA